MPRFTEENVKNEFAVQDKLSGDELMLYYRTPTAEEHIKYSKEKLVRRGNKFEDRLTETLIKYGGKILTGIRKGDFARRVGGKTVLYSSESGDPDYDPNWKELLRAHAADLLILLGMHVFEPASGNTFRLEDSTAEEDPEKN